MIRSGATRPARIRARERGRAAAWRTGAFAAGSTMPTLATPALAEAGEWAGAVAGRFRPHDAAGLAVMAGLVVFAAILSILHLRERGRWTRRERALSAELDRLAGAHARAEMRVGADRQGIATWNGRAEPLVEGDPTLALDEGARGVTSPAAGLRRALAFGTWLPPADAAAVEAAVEALRARGERFRLGLRTPGGRDIEAEGRAVGGRALLRLREVTGERRALIEAVRARETAEAALATTAALLDAIPHPLWRRDADGTLAWANAAYLAAIEATDLADARARGLELLDRATRDESERDRRAGRHLSARVSAVVAGTRRVLDVIEAPADGGAIGTAVDVSELEGVRADLQRQRDAHVRTLDQLPTGVAIFDARQRLTFHNAAYRQLWGLDAAFLDGRPQDGEILEHLRALRRLPEQANFRAWKGEVLAAYRGTEAQQTWWYPPDGRTLRVVADPNPQGGLTYLFDDVTERVHLESRYNALMRVQSETLETLKEAVAVFGSDGRLKFANRAFAATWRLDPEDLADQPHVDRVVELCRPLAASEEPWAEMRGAVAGLADARLGLTCRMDLLDGTVLDCGSQPLPDGATLLTLIDVTAGVNVERALTDRNEALELAGRIREEFVHHVSYELRSPLTNIIGFAELLGDETVGALNERQRDYAGHITRSSASLLAIINDILDLASIDAGSIELDRETVDVRATVEAAARGLEDRFAESQIKLALDVSDDVGTLVADGKRVRQILFNLLSNAVGFSERGQTVTVRARTSPEACILEVIDQGRGMPPDVAASVFERFESRTLGTRHRGVGLGLSIVRSFVELHGGRVELVSAPGRGTRVTCTFPRGGDARLEAAE